MSVIGFDIGNESCVIAAAKRGGIDVLLNDEDKRETPSIVSFGDKQRFLGSAGAAFATSNPKSTISQIKRLVGRLYNEPSVQEDLKLLPFVTSEGPRGGILVELEYLNKKWTFSPVEILGMLFTHLKQVAEKNLESPVVDCVIGIPSYFTDLQRRQYLDAARIAGVRPLRLMHDGSATALGYGIYKTDLSRPGPTVVVFVDIGHCDTQVTVAAFQPAKMKILSHSFDPNLGGRDFDEVLFRHFAAEFKEKYKIDVYSNARASIRLRASCGKVKKVLSANTEAPISIECLIGDTDVRGVIKREEFEKLSYELLERVTVPCVKAVEDSGISDDKIYTIELVGSGSRIPAITKILTLLFNKEPTRILNASECVARGCAVRCAMLSPAVIVRNYQIDDIFPYSIALPLDELKNELHKELVLFPKGSPFPSDKMIKHYGSTKFYFQVSYTNKMDFPAGVSPIVGHFQIGENSGPETRKVQFNMRLNVHGIVEIESALNFDVATTKEELHEAQEREQVLAEQDKKVEENKDRRNTLESFVFDTRSKLSNAYRSFASESEKKVITNSLQETEDWLYEDGDDESEQDYTGKLDYLKELLDPIENRYKYETGRLQATKALQTRIAEYRSFADSMSHSQKQQFNDECIKVQQHVENNPPENGDWSSFMKNILNVFERHDKPVNPNERDKYDHPNQGEERGHLNQREKLVEPNQKDHHADVNQSDKLVDSNQRDELVDLDQKEKRMDRNQRDNHMDSNKRDKLVGESQSLMFRNDLLAYIKMIIFPTKLMDPNHRDNRKDSNQRNIVDPNQREKLQDSNHIDNSMYSNQRVDIVDPNQRYNLADRKEELNEAQEKEQMLAEQDKKAEENIDKRNILTSSVYDTRSKTDETRMGLAKEKNIVKEEPTKEKEHSHSKSLNLDDNENKDADARVIATKPLVNCLEEYRLISGSLPPSQKEEINNECIRVEQWLNDLTQQHSSNSNIDPIRLSRIIKDAMEYFERRCKRIMES